MLVNKDRDFTPFDMKRKPAKQNLFLMLIAWAGLFLITRKNHLKIIRKDMKGVKPPYLIFSTHQGFSDYYIAPLALFPHRANYVSDMEGFAAFGYHVYRAFGCIGKRRYVPDISVMVNIRYALRKKRSVVIFPESRHSNVGTTSQIPDNLGRLAAFLGVNVLVLSAHGSYLANPFWDEERSRKVPMEATLRCIYTADQLKHVSAEEIQKTIEDALTYDEYAWQREKAVRITEKFRAEGLHKPLYICRKCTAKYSMSSRGTQLICNACHSTWEYTEEGYLICDNEKIHIPDWYEWERREAAEGFKGSPQREYKVYVEALPNEKGFIPLGEGMLLLDEQCFTLRIDQKEMKFGHYERKTVQTEYNYREKGMCIVLSDSDCCYYIYSKSEDFNPTELQFIVEDISNKN